MLASQFATVSQDVSGTTITVEYYRPLARGRTLFGGVVKWDDWWTPGANWATTLETSTGIGINGQCIAHGKYSLWLEVKEHGPWLLILNREARVFHLWPPPPDGEEARIPVVPRQGPHAEALLWYFPEVAESSTELRMHWGSTFITLRLRTPCDQKI